ncbi:MAG: hypothetical protein HC820_03840 [Hydrococcus sp. RM1_1_31]|nr:hypothetical protein [Hydrococcus sp. RM1_1_31]
MGILGELGLLDPADESSRVGEGGTISDGSSDGNPYSNPETPEEVYELQRYTDVVRSEIPQELSQIVFGPEGQKSQSQQTEDLQLAQQATLEASLGANDAYEESVKLSKENADSAETVDAEADKAQSSKASQDVLKAIASQNADLAKIGAGTSSQLAQIGKAVSYQAAQLNATNTQLTALNDKTQVLTVLSASQNYQLAQLDAAIDHQSHYQQIKDSTWQRAAAQSSSVVYIPGLVKP